jgi:hypothetical protein
MNDQLVEPLFEREPSNAPGAFYVVKNHCITCSAPVEAAPATMSWNQSPNQKSCALHCRVHKQPETEEELKAMIEAVDISCVQAIRYCGTDERIVAALKKLKLEAVCDALHRR